MSLTGATGSCARPVAWRRRVAGVAVALAMVAAACSGDSDDAPPAPTTTIDPAQTTTTVDPTSVALPAVSGRTATPAAMRPGKATVRGLVTGPEGPIEGAIVEVARLVFDQVVAETLATGPDGRFEVAGVLGGRYRLRAWRAPDLGMTEPQVHLVGDVQVFDANLALEGLGGIVPTVALAPDPPDLGERTSLVIRLHDQSVDGAGVVQAQPRAGAVVELLTPRQWRVEGENPRRTDGGGTVTFVVTCSEVGDQGLRAVVDGEHLVDLGTRRCGPLPTTTTEPSAPPPG